MSSRRLVASTAVVLLLAAACGGGGAQIERLHLQDYPAPAMFRETALHLKRPFILELPPRPAEGRFDLEMNHVSVEEALEAMVRLDPTFQQSQEGEVLVFRPSGKADVEGSPFSKEIRDVHLEGGAGEVLRQLLERAALADTTRVTFSNAGLRRPVKVDVREGTVRDGLVQIAAQAHLALQIEPGSVSAGAAPE